MNMKNITFAGPFDLTQQKIDHTLERREQFIKENGYDKGTHPVFKVGDKIQFISGYNNDILYHSNIMGIDGNDLYVYYDCYWFPIQADDEKIDIKILI